MGQTINGITKARTNSGSHKKAIFFELLGSGMLYSLNYDFRLKPNSNQGFGLRVGLGKGTYTSNETFGSRYTTLPVNFNYILGNKRSGLEAGVSFTPEFSFQRFDDQFNFYSILNLGYRYQPINSGLLFRLAYTPILIGERSHPPIGISVGYELNKILKTVFPCLLISVHSQVLAQYKEISYDIKVVYGNKF
ncbi:hypothetical protein GZH53_15725 [Flavihumibacter sp. R14]|nr:hypothetical protein [Flavihumibacter soli]